jgi:hypothetical protein
VYAAYIKAGSSVSTDHAGKRGICVPHAVATAEGEQHRHMAEILIQPKQASILRIS